MSEHSMYVSYWFRAYLVDLTPLPCFLFHKPSVDAGHDFVELSTGDLLDARIKAVSKSTHKLNVLDAHGQS